MSRGWFRPVLVWSTTNWANLHEPPVCCRWYPPLPSRTPNHCKLFCIQHVMWRVNWIYWSGHAVWWIYVIPFITFHRIWALHSNSAPRFQIHPQCLILPLSPSFPASTSLQHLLIFLYIYILISVIQKQFQYRLEGAFCYKVTGCYPKYLNVLLLNQGPMLIHSLLRKHAPWIWMWETIKFSKMWRQLSLDHCRFIFTYFKFS